MNHAVRHLSAVAVRAARSTHFGPLARHNLDGYSPCIGLPSTYGHVDGCPTGSLLPNAGRIVDNLKGYGEPFCSDAHPVRARGNAANGPMSGPHPCTDGASLAPRRRGLVPGTTKSSNAERPQRLAHDNGRSIVEWNRSRRTLVPQGMGAEAQSDASGCPMVFQVSEAA